MPLSGYCVFIVEKSTCGTFSEIPLLRYMTACCPKIYRHEKNPQLPGYAGQLRIFDKCPSYVIFQYLDAIGLLAKDQ